MQQSRNVGFVAAHKRKKVEKYAISIATLEEENPLKTRPWAWEEEVGRRTWRSWGWEIERNIIRWQEFRGSSDSQRVRGGWERRSDVRRRAQAHSIGWQRSLSLSFLRKEVWTWGEQESGQVVDKWGSSVVDQVWCDSRRSDAKTYSPWVRSHLYLYPRRRLADVELHKNTVLAMQIVPLR